MDSPDTTNRHTPGPWEYIAGPQGDPDFEDCEFLIAEQRPKGDVVATVVGPVRQGAPEANARLIAAAPDLLLSLRTFVAANGIANYDSTLCWGCEQPKTGECDAFCLLRRARAAIAAAEGRS